MRVGIDDARARVTEEGLMASPGPLDLPPPGPKIVQIAAWGNDAGGEVLYALKDDGTLWRAVRAPVGGPVVWRAVRGIEEDGASAFEAPNWIGRGTGPVVPGERQW